MRAADRLTAIAESGRQAGQSELVRGQCGHADGASLFPLTVLECQEGAVGVLDREEAFGPLVAIRPFHNTDATLAEVAAERHALAAYVYGADSVMKQRIATRWRFGSIGFDTIRIQSPTSPTGGFGLAGFGREGGVYGLQEYMTTMNVCDRAES
jgi:succinate-semialdehyde dehydrogenase/glutarate-semialdehyde dehydrogenase